MRDVRTQVDRALLLLRNVLHQQGYSQLEVQEPLGWGRSYISQLLTRQKALRFSQIILILGVIGVEPEEFFAELYHWPRQEPAEPRVPSHPRRNVEQIRRRAENEVDRVLAHLRATMSARGYTHLEVQQELHWGRSYISQLLHKAKSLRLAQVVSILSVLDVPPSEFFFELYRPGQKMPPRPSLAPPPPPPPPDPRVDEVRAVVRRLSWVLVEKGVLTRTEVPMILDELLADEPGPWPY